MSRFQKFLGAVLLTSAAGVSTLAGDMNFPVTPPPPPINTVVVPGANAEETGVDPTAELLIIVLESLLPIF